VWWELGGLGGDDDLNPAERPLAEAGGDLRPDIAMQDVDQLIASTVHGVILARRAERPTILDNKSGAIVNVFSVGVIGVPDLSASIASKHGVTGPTKSVGLEYATRKIRINAIAPAGTDTEMLASGLEEQQAFLASLSPIKRIADASEIAVAIIYLLADASLSTGVMLSADGGQSVA
jgi:NAD(P)-dependent dehydrogenase (short-subunit alcohol dehydrogenase family)